MDDEAHQTIPRLRARIAALEREIELRDGFIAVAAHELRNPLTPIALEVEVLLALARRRAAPSTAEIASLERLRRAMATYLRRAETLLDVTRLQSGTVSLESLPVDLAEVALRVVEASSPLARAANCALEFEAERAVAGFWDPRAVEQIVENLISNALRYGAGAPVRLRISSEPGIAELRVCDRGIGIAAEEQVRIFECFQRGSQRTATSPGFGVGLWITRRLARAMSGDVTVESSPGAGATFILRLPAQDPQDDVNA